MSVSCNDKRCVYPYNLTHTDRSRVDACSYINDKSGCVCLDRRRVYPYNLTYTDRSHVAECILMIRVGVSVSRCRLKVTLHH